jgi:hypothetical protein
VRLNYSSLLEKKGIDLSAAHVVTNRTMVRLRQKNQVNVSFFILNTSPISVTPTDKDAEWEDEATFFQADLDQ